MAIPNRTTITCPTCAATEDVIVVDTSVGPGGRNSPTPVYSMAKRPLWTVTRHDGNTYVSCTSCGEAEFTTLAKLASNRTW